MLWEKVRIIGNGSIPNQGVPVCTSTMNTDLVIVENYSVRKYGQIMAVCLGAGGMAGIGGTSGVEGGNISQLFGGKPVRAIVEAPS